MSKTRLLIINFTGDVRDAYHRLNSGGPETYYAQRYTLEAQQQLGQYVDEVCVLAYVTKERYDTVLPNGVRALGGGLSDLNDPAPIFSLIEKLGPTHVALCTPDWRVVRWLASKPYRCIGCFASSIPNLSRGFVRRLAARVRNAQLAHALNHPTFEWVGSYGLASCDMLADVGVSKRKIVPWDLLLEADAGPYPPKALPDPDSDSSSGSVAGFSVCYVGAIHEGKGVGDLIDAVAQLNQDNFPVRATIVGNDGDGFARERIARHGLQDKVTLPGLLPNAEIEPLMNRCDVVVVPSRPEYPEGFPLVIHHGLRSRTPIVASNHPVFLLHLKHEVSAMLFAAGDAQALAAALKRLLRERELYERLSTASHDTWLNLRLPVKWADVIRHWVREAPGDHAWLAQHSLAGRRGDAR